MLTLILSNILPMSSTFRFRVAAITSTLLLLLGSAPAHASTVSTQTLIKGSSSAVYYFAENGKRYVFPTESTYFTWYADFSTVQTVSDSDLAEIPIGGNVTYRPGVKLVKITTDPKVYAVASDGTLRWVTSEAVAPALYGADWNTKVDDIPDAFFVNYTVGADINNASDFSPTAETQAATNIDVDKRINGETPSLPPNDNTTSTPPTTTTATFGLSVDKTSVQSGDVIYLTATSSDVTNVSKIEIFFDGSLVTSCPSASCSGETQIPTSGTKTSYVAEAKLSRLDGTTETKDVTITVQADGQHLVQVSIDRVMIKSGETVGVAVTADASIAVNRIDIFVDDVDVKGCATGARECRWGDVITGAVSSTHPVYGKVTDTLGRTYTSAVKIITIGTTDAPMVTVSTGKTLIYVGETLDVTVTASDDDGIASIDVMKDGAVLKHCDSAAPCTATTGPWNTAGTITFTGQATDALGAVGQGDPLSITVTNPS